MAKKKINSDSISIERGGHKFVGHRTIEGTRKLFQTIHYGTTSKADGHAYKPGEGTYMNNIARTILRELVQETGDYPKEADEP